MLDFELLNTLVAVIDAGGFTRAAERLHRTQSTVSQQIKRLEDQVGRRLLTRERSGGSVLATEDGELLLGYARRLLTISAEAQEALRRPAIRNPVRLGVTEDFAGRQLIELLSGFALGAPGIRLHTVSAWSMELRKLLEVGEIDLALIKREPGEGSCLAKRTERLVWVGGDTPMQPGEPVPLALFPQGCIYRTRAVAAMEASERPWFIAYTSQGLGGVQAAVVSGLGVSLLPEDALLQEHRRLSPEEGFPAQSDAEIALVARSGRLGREVRSLSDYLVDRVLAPK